MDSKATTPRVMRGLPVLEPTTIALTGEHLVRLSDFLVSSGAVPSVREAKRLAGQQRAIEVVTAPGSVCNYVTPAWCFTAAP
jgi:hypothetical protein